MHLGAGLILIVVPGMVWWRVVLVAITCASLYRTVRNHALRRGPQAIVALTLSRDGGLAVCRRDGSGWVDVSLVAAFIHPWLVVLRLHLPQQRFPAGLLVAADAVDSDGFRRLRARLNLRNRVE